MRFVTLNAPINTIIYKPVTKSESEILKLYIILQLKS